MSEKMTLITLEANGHVLGVVTRVGDPEGKLTPKDLVGDGLLIRNPVSGEVQLAVEPQQLKVETADLLKELLFQPSHYALVNNVPTLMQVLVSPPDPPISIFTELKLKITSGPPLKLGDKVWAQIENRAANYRSVHQAQAVPDPGAAGNTMVEFNLSLQPGTYHLLALVPGYHAVRVTKTFP